MTLLEFWVHGFRNVIPSLQLQFLIFFHLKMGKFWSLLSKLMGSGTHYSRIDGFPGTHANGAIGTWHYFVLRIWRCLKCEEKIMQRVPNRIHSIKVHTAWLPLYYEQFGTFCIIFDICPLHKQHIVLYSQRVCKRIRPGFDFARGQIFLKVWQPATLKHLDLQTSNFKHINF